MELVKGEFCSSYTDITPKGLKTSAFSPFGVNKKS